FTATTGGGTAPFTFAWIFGNGMTGSGSPVSLTYSAAGNFTVQLNAADSGSQQATASNLVMVSSVAPPPPPVLPPPPWPQPIPSLPPPSVPFLPQPILSFVNGLGEVV